AGLDLDETAVLDGFLMEGGVADETEPHDAGSVMYNDGSSPVVKNGWIYWNYSYKGAVFYNKDSSMKVMDTQFVNNEAPYSKGGVFYNENSNIEISGCDFANSWAEGDNDSRGGAIYSVGGKTVVTDTVLKSNLANMGGAIFIESGDLEVSGCTFDENQGEFGGAIYLNDSDSSVIKDTIFQYNVTYDYGDTDGKGGAIRISSSNLKIINSTFFKQISGIGGAVFSSAPDSETSTLTIINSGFSINKMIGWGGAIYLDKTSTEIINSVFFKNYYGYTSQGTIGGAIYRTDSGSLNIVNSIFKSNTAGTGKHIHDAAGNATVTYSCIVDTTVYPGTGNINDEPMLTEPEWAPLDFTLKPDSPCIDTGSNTPFDAGNIAEGITKDMSGNDRIIKGKETSPSAIVDMGAVEFKPAP
ncbi:MAG TPA: choice-of-anchor Q domain-containing protein, partial [bacterium]|nr:choice-of-anchor Q domain-containing protein [bacterium]